MTHGLSHWLPLHGLGAAATNDLALRSGMGACGGFSINDRDPTAVAALRKHLDPQQRYEMENFDGGKEVRTGEELMSGFDITLREKPFAAVFVLNAIL